MNYAQQLSDIRLNIISEIINIIKTKGGNPYELIDVTDEHLQWQDDFYDLPRTFIVDKYSHYDEYALIAVSIKDDNLELEGLAIDTENDTDQYTFDANDISLESLSNLLNFIIELEN